MANPDIFQELRVALPARDYPIIIGYHLLSAKNIYEQYVNSSQVLIVTNTSIAPLYLPYLQAVFVDKQCDVVILEDGEHCKNQASLFQIYDALLANSHHRDTTLLALGGGVVGDICGFAASTYQRGVNVLQIPTTLLAQVDASVGGKTAINHPAGKNMIGSFYQPKAVIIDINTLQSLPEREFRAGFAEIIKYAILAGGDFFYTVYHALQGGLSHSSLELPAIISHCCQIKAAIVQEDERESGARVLLNLGHTVAHALEAYTGYKRWLHGEAVSIGLYCVALLSYEHYGLSKTDFDAIQHMLILSGLPCRIPRDIDINHLYALMAHDKKIKDDKLPFVLIKTLGHCYLDNTVKPACILKILQVAIEGE